MTLIKPCLQKTHAHSAKVVTICIVVFQTQASVALLYLVSLSATTQQTSVCSTNVSPSCSIGATSFSQLCEVEISPPCQLYGAGVSAQSLGKTTEGQKTLDLWRQPRKI
jgi:hypothetical protein